MLMRKKKNQNIEMAFHILGGRKPAEMEGNCL